MVDNYTIVRLNSSGTPSAHYIFRGYRDDGSEYVSLDATKSSTLKKYSVNESIYLDDTIDTIKRKISKCFNMAITPSEMYLFGIMEKKIFDEQLYNTITQDGRNTLIYDTLSNTMKNYKDFKEEIPEKETYSFEDIISLNVNDKTMKYVFPIGQQYTMKNNYPIVHNPFRIDSDYSYFLKQYDGQILTTQNNSLLLSTNSVFDKTIYLCTCEDVLTDTNDKLLSSSITIKLYFPLLFEQNITTLGQLRKEKSKLQQQMKKRMKTQRFEQYVSSIHLLKDLGKPSNKPKIKYKYKGIKQITFTITQRININIPLELIFKLIPTEETLPFIKFNPGPKKETIFRLYADRTTTNGKKIPYLTKTEISNLNFTLAKKISVAMHIHYKQKKDGIDTIECVFNENGSITIQMEIIDVKEGTKHIEEAVRDHVNGIINKVKNLLEQHGYNFDTFDTLEDDNITIDNILYQSYLSIKKIDIAKNLGCLSSIVNLIDDNLSTTGIRMRFKRVSNFDKMDSIEAFITELTMNDKRKKTILEALEHNFSLEKAEAEKKYMEWISSVKIMGDVKRRKRFKIVSNPGFPLIIKRNRVKTDIYTISVDNIDNIGYLSTIPIYLDSIIRVNNKKKIHYRREYAK